MGEVWRAKDTTLGRDVAIKTLPAEFAPDDGRVERFTREARLLAALNHPNIASIFGMETSHGTPFLVLELIEGDTLADRLSKSIAGSSGHDGRPRNTPIPVEESLRLAIQIADALKAAHESGVIHRDLKPANIKVNGDGRVKVLDFGLAKTFALDAAVISGDSPTVSLHTTRPGVVLGTAGYMSPEQVKGEAVDKRADIWAFGCVLYEMLTGRQAFGATDPTTIMARVVDREPDFSILPANLHPRLTDLLRRCLRKDAKHRYQDIGDVRMDLDAILADPSGPIVEPVTRVDATPRSSLWWAAAVLVAAVVAGAAGWVLKPAPPSDPRLVNRFEYWLPDGLDFHNRSANVIALAPDGQSYVYNATGGLYLRFVKDLQPQLISGTEDVTNPFFSPDGQWIGFWNRTSKAIEKVAVTGGAAVRIVPFLFEPSGISWSSDDTILWARVNTIGRVSSNSGTPERIFEAEPDKVLSGPTLLPDGKGILFTEAKDGKWDEGEIFVVSLDPSRTRTFVLKGRAARYLSTGHIIYAVGNQLLVSEFNLAELKTVGTPVRVARGVVGAGTSDSANYGVSNDGSLMLVADALINAVGDALTLVWVDRTGKETAIHIDPAAYVWPRLSPKGTHIAAFVSTTNNDVWTVDLTRQPPARARWRHPSLDAFPVWTPDSEYIVFSSDRGERPAGRRAFFQRRADGASEAEHLIDVETSNHWWAHSFSPSGGLLAFSYRGSTTGADIGLISLEGARTWKPLIETPAQEFHPAISPTGNWVAYSSDLGGTQDVYIDRFPNLGQRVPISTGGGLSPLWSGNETELFYVRGDGAIMTVPIQHGSKLTVGKARVIVPAGPYLTTRKEVVNYDYDPKRQRFLLVRPVRNDDPKSRPRIVTILNWFTELAEQMPKR
jgi:serine/threonine-protein kinase